MTDRALTVYDFIKTNPGLSATRVARALGMSEGAVRNALVGTEKSGLLLYEEKGKLYIWKGDGREKEKTHL